MKTEPNRNHLSKFALAPLALVLLLLAGCLEKNLLWSPDGSRAAVLGEEGLTLCDADGQLSPLFLPGVYRVAWLGDSQQLVVARYRQTGSWNEIAGILGDGPGGAVVAQAEAIWKNTPSGGLGKELTTSVPGRNEHDILISLYLREHYGQALQAKVAAAEWEVLQGRTIELHELDRAKIEDGKIALGTCLFVGSGNIREIRVAPGDRALALVTETGLTATGKEEDFQLWLAPMNEPGAKLLATHVGAFPDWTADGRSLAYLQASGGNAKDDLLLGTLVQRTVLDAKGGMLARPEKTDLAGCMFSANTRVRCLRDGRILFNAAEISLPIAAEDYGDQREQLFALDPARQATLVRLVPRQREKDLPQALSFFEVSPNEQQVLFGAFDGKVCVLTLASGTVERVQEGSKINLQGQPVWRRDGEFSYTHRATGKDDKVPARQAEVVLRSNTGEKVLSTGWPDKMVNHLVSEKK